jgi:hypothetical protein
LQEYHRAISSEFAADSDTDLVSATLSELNQLLTTATQSLQRLLIAAESESVQMSAIKLVFDYTLGKPGATAGEDEITKLLTSLTVKKPQTDTNSTSSTS